MAMNRMQRRLMAQRDIYQSGHNKPPTRAQAQAWLAPIRAAFAEMKSGEIDAYRGYAITKIRWADEDFARVDFAINGFTALLDRLDPTFDTRPMKAVSKKLANGILLTVEEIDRCFAVLKECEDLLLKFTRAQLKDAAQTEQINIELERMGIKEAA